MSTVDYQSELVRPPSLSYLEVMTTGLRQTYGMSGGEIAEYLAGKPGIKGVFTTDELSVL